jgi:hypothetical protein
LDTIGHNFEIPISEVPLARDRFPITAFHPAIVVAAVFSGKRCSGVWVKRLGAWHKRPYNFARQRLIFIAAASL